MDLGIINKQFMFSILKTIIWIAGFLFVTYWLLGYFGYEINREYFTNSKKLCQERLKLCSEELIKKGTEGAQCDFNCVNPKLIIKKK
jgi:hypothetical protein